MEPATIDDVRAAHVRLVAAWEAFQKFSPGPGSRRPPESEAAWLELDSARLDAIDVGVRWSRTAEPTLEEIMEVDRLPGSELLGPPLRLEHVGPGELGP